MVVAADDVGDPHVMVVHDNGQHIGGCAVGAQDHHVVKGFVLHADGALDGIVDGCLAVVRHANAHDERPVARSAAIAPWRAHGKAIGHGALPHVIELGVAHITAIGGAAGQKLLRHFGVPRGALGLHDRGPVALKPKPAKRIVDGVDGLACGALPVGVLDAKQKFAAMVVGEQPVEKGGARTADMQESGWRGGEAGDDVHEGYASGLGSCGLRGE